VDFVVVDVEGEAFGQEAGGVGGGGREAQGGS
jgi:hypothetical protein